MKKYRAALMILTLLVVLPVTVAVAQAAPLPGPVGAEMDFDALSQLLAMLALVAYLIEAVVEVLFLSWLAWVVENFTPGWAEEKRAELRALIRRLATYVIGIALSVTIGFDLIAAVIALFGAAPDMPEVAAIVGKVLTGILMGRGAQWFHDFGTEFFGLDVVKRRPSDC